MFCRNSVLAGRDAIHSLEYLLLYTSPWGWSHLDLRFVTLDGIEIREDPRKH